MTKSERVALRRDIRRRRIHRRTHTIGYTPERTKTMQVTITIPKSIRLSQAQLDSASHEGLRVTLGIASLFIEGDLDTAAEYARRFEAYADETPEA